MMQATGRMARSSKTPRPLVVARPLVKVVKRSKEEDFRVLDGG